MMDPFTFLICVLSAICVLGLLSKEDEKNKKNAKALGNDAPKADKQKLKSYGYSSEKYEFDFKCPYCKKTPTYTIKMKEYNDGVEARENLLNLLQKNSFEDPMLVKSLDSKLDMILMYNNLFFEILKMKGAAGVYEYNEKSCNDGSHTITAISGTKAREYRDKAREIRDELYLLHEQMSDLIIERKKIANGDSDNYIKIMIEANKEANKMFLGIENKKDGELK